MKNVILGPRRTPRCRPRVRSRVACLFGDRQEDDPHKKDSPRWTIDEPCSSDLLDDPIRRPEPRHHPNLTPKRTQRGPHSLPGMLSPASTEESKHRSPMPQSASMWHGALPWSKSTAKPSFSWLEADQLPSSRASTVKTSGVMAKTQAIVLHKRLHGIPMSQSEARGRRREGA